MKKTKWFFSIFLLTALMVYSKNTEAKAETLEQAYIPVYRLYNSINGEHLYTTSQNEVLFLNQHNEENGSNWGYEGIAWYSATIGTPVYRLYNNILCNHLYTSDQNEIDTLLKDSSWSIDNNGQPLFYSYGEIPIYRLYNKELFGMHHLTSDKNEYDTLPFYGWSQEDIALYAYKMGKPTATTEYLTPYDSVASADYLRDIYHNNPYEDCMYKVMKYDDTHYCFLANSPTSEIVTNHYEEYQNCKDTLNDLGANSHRVTFTPQYRWCGWYEDGRDYNVEWHIYSIPQ